MNISSRTTSVVIWLTSFLAAAVFMGGSSKQRDVFTDILAGAFAVYMTVVFVFLWLCWIVSAIRRAAWGHVVLLLLALIATAVIVIQDESFTFDGSSPKWLVAFPVSLMLAFFSMAATALYKILAFCRRKIRRIDPNAAPCGCERSHSMKRRMVSRFANSILCGRRFTKAP